MYNFHVLREARWLEKYPGSVISGSSTLLTDMEIMSYVTYVNSGVGLGTSHHHVLDVGKMVIWGQS
jgi:hypothetical protein